MMQRIKTYMYGASTVMWMLTIYGFSAENKAISGGKSRRIAAFFELGLKRIKGDGISYDKETFIWEFSHVIRKCAHFGAFFVLAMLLFLLIESHSGKKNKLLPVVFAALFAMTDEFHQSLVPGRNPSIKDVGIDVAGAILGVMFVILFLSRLRKNIRELS